MQLDGMGDTLPGRIYGRELNCSSFPGQVKWTTCSGKKAGEERAVSGIVSRGTVTGKGGEEGSEIAAGRNSYCATDAQKKRSINGIYCEF